MLFGLTPCDVYAMTPRTWRILVRGWNRRAKEAENQGGTNANVMPLDEARSLAEYYRKLDKKHGNRKAG